MGVEPIESYLYCPINTLRLDGILGTADYFAMKQFHRCILFREFESKTKVNTQYMCDIL